MSSRRTAIAFPRWTALLSHLLSSDHGIHLIICMSKENFAENVIAGSLSGNTVLPAGHLDLIPSILTPSLSFAQSSRNISVTFAPSLMHLRAHLVGFMEPCPDSSDDKESRDDSEPPLILALVGLLNLHTPTSEFSAQGLSRTLALAVDAADQRGSGLQIAELTDRTMHDSDDQGGHTPPGPWKQNVPLLNSSIRSQGDDQIWAGRSLEYGSVVRAWCQLQQPECRDFQ